jgi:hypothetical protein
MQLNCELSQCITHCALTAIGVIVFTIILDIILYFAYSYFIVRKYYSGDLFRKRNRELARYGYFEPGTAGADWKEIYPPIDAKSQDVVFNSIAANDNWIWATAKNDDIYVCKKPCDGTSKETFWHQFPGKLRQISTNNGSVWGVNRDDSVFGMGTRNDKGNWGGNPARLRNISVGSTGWIWGTNGSRNPYVCHPKGACWKRWYPATGIKSIQVTAGQNYVWSLDNAGSISVRSSNGAGKWAHVPSPTSMSYIACGLSDNLFAISEDGGLYMLKGAGMGSWIVVKNAPKLRAISVNKEIYGLGQDNTIWEGTLPA